jgi:hypothetical protein
MSRALSNGPSGRAQTQALSKRDIASPAKPSSESYEALSAAFRLCRCCLLRNMDYAHHHDCRQLKSSYYPPHRKSQTCNKHDKDMPKGGGVYSEWVVLLPILTSGGE